MEQKKVIAITGGGTGGHIFPLLGLYNHLKDNYDFIWVGEQDGMEEEVAEKNNIKFLDISAGKIRRYFDIKNFYEPLKNLTGIFEGIYYIFKYKIKIVFSKGGYVSIPLCLAAKLLGKKIFVHESDTIGGISNKIIGKLATKIFYTFPNEKIDGNKHILSGQLLNQEVLEGLDNGISITENERLNVVVIAGSQGSTNIFNNLITILPDLSDIDFKIILGEKNLHFKEPFSKFKNVITYDFVSQKELGKILKNSDIAITRAGATALWELFYFGIHSIIIPLSGSAGNHQEQNGEYFKTNFGSDLLLENTENLEEDENKLALDLYKLLKKYKDLRKHGLNLKGFSGACNTISEEIEKIIN